MKKVKKKQKKKTRILLKAYANLQTMIKTPVQFQKDWSKTVGGVALTRYLNSEPGTTHHSSRTTESQIPCPLTFLRKGGDTNML